MIDVEVKGRLNQYIKAVLRNVVDEGVVVYYPEKNEEERVPFSNVRVPPPPGKEVQPGQQAEVLYPVADKPDSGQVNISSILPGRWGDEADNKPDLDVVLEDNWDNLSVPSWWPCRVLKVRDEVAAVKLHVIPPPDATQSEVSLCTQLSTVTEIVNRDILRQPNADAPCLTPEAIHRHSIEIPKELADFASDPSVHQDFLRHCGGPISHYYDPESSCLVVLSTDSLTAKNVALLEETHLQMLRQKWALTRSLRQTMRNLEANRGSDISRSVSGGMKSNGNWSTDPSHLIEKFYVPQHLMGLAIGAHGVNIRAAREIPNVVRIITREQSESGPIDSEPVDNCGDYSDAVMFIIEGKTQEACKQARARLEFTELYLGVPRRYVGRLIGRRTMNILSIIRKSGVVHIHFDDHVEGPPSANEDSCPPDMIKYGHTGRPRATRRIFLRAGGVQASSQPHADEEYGGFFLAGTKDSIEKARLLINFQMDYFYDLERMESEKLELMRTLSHGGPESGSGFPQRGPSVGRWNERGMSSYARGGRGRRGGRGGLLHPPVGANGNAPGSNYIDDENVGNGISYRGGRRPPRDMRSQRVSGGGSRVSRGRGSHRTSGHYRDSDWNDHTGSNGDVADRRRGSEDSDIVDSNVGLDGSSSDRNNGGRRSRVARAVPASNGFYSDKERGDESDVTPNLGGDASSEDNGGNSVDNLRHRLTKPLHNRADHQSSDGGIRNSRQNRHSRTDQWNSNGQTNNVDSSGSHKPRGMNQTVRQPAPVYQE